jgi:hypothetical protein
MAGEVRGAKSDVAARLVGPALLAAAVLALVCFGVVGVGREGMQGFDGRVLFAAGRAWLMGLNPYDHAQLVRAVAGLPDMNLDGMQFLYPPQSGAMCAVLGLFPYAIARLAWLVFNLVSVAAIAWGTVSLLRSRPGGEDDRLGQWVVAAAFVACPFTAHVVFMGQTTIVAFAATMGAWLLSRSGRRIAAGLCLGLASYKPQVSILVIVWFLLERDWRTLLVAAVTGLVLALVPMVEQGPLGTFLAWRTGVQQNYDLQFNLPGAPHKIGLESLLAAAGVALPGVASSAMALLFTVLVWLRRDRIAPEDRLGLLMVVTFTFSRHLHDYDFVGLAPVFASLWWWSRQRASLAPVLLGLPVLLFIPQRLVRHLDVPVALHWRTLVVPAIALAILAVARRGMAPDVGASSAKLNPSGEAS